MKTISVALIGAGNRGMTYTDLMTDDRFKVVAVCEPTPATRNYVKKKHNIPDENCFDGYEEFFAKGKCADAVVIATTDRMHFEPVMKAIELGYDILLEKPVSPDPKECVTMANAAKEKGVKILVCHVLRYSPIIIKIKEMIDEGKLGNVHSIHHIECVGNVHQSHSFVRGNWHNEAQSSFMLLQKSCHDMDIIQYLMGKKCKRVHSFGSLVHFREENAPKGATLRCTDGCPHQDTCHYSAITHYLKNEHNLWFKDAATQNTHPSDEEMIKFLKETDYGKCVYRSDNDVVDCQVVNLEFEDGSVASFNMNAFNRGGRFIRVMGTNGELYGDMSRKTIEYYSFDTYKTETIDLNQINELSIYDKAQGHGGGDSGIVSVLYKYLAEDFDGDILSEIGISVENHLIAFAAEESRRSGKVISLDDYSKSYDLK